jgi:hypothetical protein
MANDLASELKALLEETDIRGVIVEPLNDGVWCGITLPFSGIYGDNIAIYARRMENMNDCPDGMIELSDFGVTDFNIDDKNIIRSECRIWHLIYGLGKRTDIHTAVAARPKDFSNAFENMGYAIVSMNNIVEGGRLRL